MKLVVKPRQALQNQIREQSATILKLEQENQRLETYLKILKRIDRRARVEVLRQAKDQQGILQTTIRFTEVDDAGKPINVSREFTLPGQEVYFDTLVIKFDDHFVEQGDPIKGAALMVFRRIFSSTMRAEDASPSTRRARCPRSTRSGKPPATSRRISGDASGTLPTTRNWRRSAACEPSTATRLHASGARPGLRNLPEIDGRSHHHAGNADGGGRGVNLP